MTGPYEYELGRLFARRGLPGSGAPGMQWRGAYVSQHPGSRLCKGKRGRRDKARMRALHRPTVWGFAPFGTESRHGVLGLTYTGKHASKPVKSMPEVSFLNPDITDGGGKIHEVPSPPLERALEVMRRRIHFDMVRSLLEWRPRRPQSSESEVETLAIAKRLRKKFFKVQVLAIVLTIPA